MSDPNPVDRMMDIIHATITKCIAKRGLTTDSDSVAIQAAVDEATTMVNEAIAQSSRALNLPPAPPIKLVWEDKKVLIQNAD